VIRGGGQGEDQPYTTWNGPTADSTIQATCGNQVCESGEDSRVCPVDCRGPVYEYGAAVLVSNYTVDGVVCGKDGSCQAGFRRSYVGVLNASWVEMRYFGQNGLRAGLTISGQGAGGAKSVVEGWAWNRGYFGALVVRRTSRVTVRSGVVFRAMLPAVLVEGGSDAVGTRVEDVMAVVGIFWNTNRGALQVCSAQHGFTLC
jgi:hypothetical protein